jgi:transposase
MDLTDQQWAAVESLLPKPEVREDGRGRPWRDPRDVLNGILWIHRTGAPWADMPSRYPPYATCFRRFQAWVKDGVLQKVLQALCDDLVARGRLDLSEAFIDGTHAGAKKGPLGGQNSAWACHQAHGDRRPLWSSNICHHRFG